MGGRKQQDLVERAKRGDQQAFAALASVAFDGLYALARRILRDADRSDDAIQECLVRAWRDLPRLRDAARFDAWLHRLLVNACYDESRRERRRSSEIHLLPVGRAGGRDAATDLADRDELERGFKRLPIEQRVVLVLSHYQGLHAAEIADTLGIPVGTVESRLHYATSARPGIFVIARGSNGQFDPAAAALRISAPAGGDHQAWDTPTWSADGTTPVTTSVSTAGDHDIILMPADGSRQRTLSSGPDQDNYPSWSVDGKRLAFQRWQSAALKRQNDTYVVNADGSGLHKVDGPALIGSGLAWSPDGSRVFGYAPDLGSVVVLTLDGSVPPVSIPAAGNIGNGTWQPAAVPIAAGAPAVLAGPRRDHAVAGRPAASMPARVAGRWPASS